MTVSRQEAAMVALRWTVGVVVLLESVYFAIATSTAHHLAKMGLPRWFGFALGGAEALAAVLFLVSATRAAGGYALLVIFAIAAVLHLLHGEIDVGGLAVYAMAVIASMHHEDHASGGARV